LTKDQFFSEFETAFQGRNDVVATLWEGVCLHLAFLDLELCPITFLAAVKGEECLSADLWEEAAESIGLDYEDATSIVYAADRLIDDEGSFNSRDRSRLLKITGQEDLGGE